MTYRRKKGHGSLTSLCEWIPELVIKGLAKGQLLISATLDRKEVAVTITEMKISGSSSFK